MESGCHDIARTVFRGISGLDLDKVAVTVHEDGENTPQNPSLLFIANNEVSEETTSVFLRDIHQRQHVSIGFADKKRDKGSPIVTQHDRGRICAAERSRRGCSAAAVCRVRAPLVLAGLVQFRNAIAAARWRSLPYLRLLLIPAKFPKAYSA